MLVPVEKMISADVVEASGSLQNLDELDLGTSEIDVDADTAQVGDGIAQGAFAGGIDLVDAASVDVR